MPETELLDLTATDVTEQTWEDLVRSMAGFNPDSDPSDPPSGCSDCMVFCDQITQ